MVQEVAMVLGFLLSLTSFLYQFPFPKCLTFVTVSSGSDIISTLILVRRIIRFVIPVVFIIKLDWSVCICLTQVYDGRDNYIIYYIKNNYMFRPFSLAIFRLINEKLSMQLHLTCVGCIQWRGKRWSGNEISHVFCRMGGVGT